MKHLRTTITICLAILLAATLGMSLSLAGTGSLEPPPGAELPYEVPYMNNGAAGMRLSGTVMIEYHTLLVPPCEGTVWQGEPGLECFNSRVYLQLTKAGVTKTFYKEGVLPGYEPLQVQVVTEMMKNAILDEFFDSDYDYNIAVVSLSEPRPILCANLDPACTETECTTATNDYCHVEYMMADVVIAVSK